MPETPPTAEFDQTSRAAILSLVFGILGFFTAGLASIAGLVLGTVALRQLRHSGVTGQRSVAVAGVTLSVLTLIAGIGMLIVLMPRLTEMRSGARHEFERQSLENVGRAIWLYALVHAGRFPPPQRWPDEIEPYLPTPMKHGDAFWGAGTQGRAYAMNAHLEGKLITDISDPPSTVLLFECETGSVPQGGSDQVAEEPRDAAGFLILFVDRHAEHVPRERLHELRWDP